MPDTDQPTFSKSSPGSERGALFRLLIHGDGTERTAHLRAERYTVGRSDDCEIPLSDPSASRRHVILEPSSDGVAFRDLGGTNVTLLDGRPCREGLLTIGSSLLVGMTRLELHHAGDRARVKLLPNQKTTAIVRLQDVGLQGHGSGELQLAGSLSERPSQTDVVARTLEVLAWPPAETGEVEAIAADLLDASLQLTSRSAGMIGLFVANAPMRVLASAQRTGRQEVAVPRDVIDDAREKEAPFLLKASDDTSESGPRVEQIVVPFGPGPAGVLVLQAPLPDACSGRAALRIASAFAPMAWRELHGCRQRAALRSELEQLRFARTSAHQIVVASTRLKTARQQVAEAARMGLAVRLLGEEGTEREEVARYYHTKTDQAAGPFIRFYCGLVPTPRAGARLLGENHGHRDAVDVAEVPLIERARGGTLFIDSPERLPLDVQQRLAEAIRMRHATAGPPGSEGRPGFRIVLAETEGTDQTICAELSNAVDGPVITIPALRGHADDIEMLCEATLGELGPQSDGTIRSLAEPVQRVLSAYEWPGNVRQLQRVLESAAARAQTRPIHTRDLPPEVRDSSQARPTVPSLSDVERRHIAHTLSIVGGNKRKAAQLLGIAVSTLYEKLKRHDLSD